MPSPNLLWEGTLLMAYGMGFVYLFLTLLVLSIGAMSRILNRYFPLPPPVSACPIRPPSTFTSDDEDDRIAAIAAALHLHRSRRR